MDLSARTLLLATAFFLPISSFGAEAGAGPSGHWEGAIHVPSGDVKVEVDLLADEHGELAGTFSNRGEHIKGFPFASVTAAGETVRLEIKVGGSAVQTFAGNLSPDGTSLTGDFLVSVYAVPFTLKRTGDAQIDAPPQNPAVDDAFTGAWSASLDVGGTPLPVSLTIANNGDGTATGDWASGGGTRTPIAIAQQERTLTLTSSVLPASFSGALNTEGTEISGTLRQGSAEQALTFTRIVAAR